MMLAATQRVNFKVIGVTEPRGTVFYMNFDKMIYV